MFRVLFLSQDVKDFIFIVSVAHLKPKVSLVRPTFS
jgi:hypothetical protein